MKYYAVAKGRKTGVYSSWDECQKQTNGYPGSKFKSFSTWKEAHQFIHDQQKSQQTRLYGITPGPTNPLPTKQTSTTTGAQAKPTNPYLTIPNPKRKMETSASAQVQISSKKRNIQNQPQPYQQQEPFKEELTANVDSVDETNRNSVSFHATLCFDGGSRGNPGIGGAGAYLEIVTKHSRLDTISSVEVNRKIHKIRSYCGSYVTNNMAEYTGLFEGLKALQEVFNTFVKLHSSQNQNISMEICIKGDSKLVIEQMKGTMRVKNPSLQVMHTKCTTLVNSIHQSVIGVQMKGLTSCSHLWKIDFSHIYRDQNRNADELANEAMDRKDSWVTVS